MSRFLDERGRIFGKVNVVDILVLLVIIAVVVFAVVRMTGEQLEDGPRARHLHRREADRRRSTVRCSCRRKATSSGMTGGRCWGRWQDVSSVDPTLEEFLTPEGELKAFDSPVFSDVDIVVRVRYASRSQRPHRQRAHGDGREGDAVGAATTRSRP